MDRTGAVSRFRGVTVYGVFLGLAAIELLLAASPGGHPYNLVGAVLAIALMVLLRA